MSSSNASSSKGKRKFNEVKKLSVLIVTNDDISQNSYILCLQNFGVETLGVRNGFMIFNIHDKTQMRFDLILMSSNMPIMDGIEATKKLRLMGITMMIAEIITPDDNEEYRKKFKKAGLDECYEKPLTKKILQSLAAKKLQSMGITTMFVRITTSDNNEEYRKQFIEVGLDEYYEKPLTKEILQSLVEKISNKFGVETLGVRNGFMAFSIHDKT
ncbi:hypothetical protein H5410_058495 [Solanum commersonii]|uniref:Response regulatory domain-containing protein n=1 Tax=Solanum commersonii TaxID=4109 RepID=A0A9J5WR86_SOLCO|nr:hypothetical protein H5410_058495 [Solanum commersonii]